MSSIERVNILGCNISCVDMNRVIEEINSDINKIRGNYICVSNVHTTITATEDSNYRRIQNQAYLTLPDGKPLSIIGKRRGYNIDRVTGPDLMEEIFKISEVKGYKHYFYGNTKENLDKFICKIKDDYPNLDIVGYQESVFRDLSDDENEKLMQQINESGTDFTWVALGAPRQEIFMDKNKNLTNSVMIGVGGAFNVIAGVSPRAPKWMQKCSLEWLFRLLDDPKRLWKRYFITNSKFIYKIMFQNKKYYEDKCAFK